MASWVVIHAPGVATSLFDDILPTVHNAQSTDAPAPVSQFVGAVAVFSTSDVKQFNAISVFLDSPGRTAYARTFILLAVQLSPVDEVSAADIYALGARTGATALVLRCDRSNLSLLEKTMRGIDRIYERRSEIQASQMQMSQTFKEIQYEDAPLTTENLGQMIVDFKFASAEQQEKLLRVIHKVIQVSQEEVLRASYNADARESLVQKIVNAQNNAPHDGELEVDHSVALSQDRAVENASPALTSALVSTRQAQFGEATSTLQRSDLVVVPRPALGKTILEQYLSQAAQNAQIAQPAAGKTRQFASALKYHSEIPLKFYVKIGYSVPLIFRLYDSHIALSQQFGQSFGLTYKQTKYLQTMIHLHAKALGYQPSGSEEPVPIDENSCFKAVFHFGFRNCTVVVQQGSDMEEICKFIMQEFELEAGVGYEKWVLGKLEACARW